VKELRVEILIGADLQSSAAQIQRSRQPSCPQRRQNIPEPRRPHIWYHHCPMILRCIHSAKIPVLAGAIQNRKESHNRPHQAALIVPANFAQNSRHAPPLSRSFKSKAIRSPIAVSRYPLSSVRRSCKLCSALSKSSSEKITRRRLESKSKP